MILLKLCAFLTLACSAVVGFEVLVDVIRFGGTRLSNGVVQPFGATLTLGLFAVAGMLTGFEGLLE